MNMGQGGTGIRVLVWCCMECNNGDLFIQILDDELQESLAHYSKSPQDIIYQQDNDLKHTCKKAQE